MINPYAMTMLSFGTGAINICGVTTISPRYNRLNHHLSKKKDYPIAPKISTYIKAMIKAYATVMCPPSLITYSHPDILKYDY